MRKVRVAPKGMGLNDTSPRRKASSPTQASRSNGTSRPSVARSRAGRTSITSRACEDQPYAEGDKSLIQCACVWGSISNASAGMGRFVPDCYGVSPWAIFVRPDSKIRRPRT